MFDLIIIGGGPAGITAAVYAARKNMNFILITKDIGGQASLSGEIDNYTGFQLVSGPELVEKFQEHMKKYNIKVYENEEVRDIEKLKNNIRIKTNKNKYETKTVIIASGKKSRELNVSGEIAYKNKGVTYCATCDGPLFAGKDVAVIGGGNSALDAVLQMVRIAHKVYVINIQSKLAGDPVMQEKIKKDKKVEVLNDSQVLEIMGEKFVSGIKIQTNGKEKILKLQGVFVEIGLVPNTGFAGIIDKNEKGEIKVNSSAETNIKCIFAAGDVTDVPEKQIIIAAGDGAKAVLSAFRFLGIMKDNCWE
ncbi:MAG: FAD-dependent oxidoreductase [bacterium]